jgi:hypothetical protein
LPQRWASSLRPAKPVARDHVVQIRGTLTAAASPARTALPTAHFVRNES